MTTTRGGRSTRPKRPKHVEIVEDLPEERSTGYDWSAIAREVQAADGKWCRLFTQDKRHRAYMLMQGSVAAMKPEHGFEVRTRNNRVVEDPERPGKTMKVCDAFVRYNRNADERNT